jgi:hypothetical protein
VQHQRLAETHYLYGASIVIAEGIMTLHDPHLRSLYDLKVCDHLIGAVHNPQPPFFWSGVRSMRLRPYARSPNPTRRG